MGLPVSRWATAARCGPRGEVLEEEVAGQVGHPLQGAGLLEEVGGAGDHHHARVRQLLLGLPVELQHGLVAAPDDQQRGRAYPGELRAREVGPPAPRDDGRHPQPRVRCRAQGGRRPGARAEEAERQGPAAGLALQPLAGRDETAGQEVDVEHQVSVGVLVAGEQVEEQGAEPRLAQHPGDPPVAGAQPAAPAPVGEGHQAQGPGRHVEDGLERPVGAGHRDVYLGRGPGGTVQEGQHLLVADLAEVPVGLSHRPERGGLVQADEVVDVPGQGGRRLVGRHRHGQDHGARPVGARDLAGGPGGGAGGHAVIAKIPEKDKNNKFLPGTKVDGNSPFTPSFTSISFLVRALGANWFNRLISRI